MKEASGDNATTGRRGPSVGSVDKSGWLKVTASTMETGGVKKNQTSVLKNGWKILKHRGKENDGKQINLNNQIKLLIGIK